MPPAGRGPMMGRMLFERADANKDGKVSLDEVREERREGFKKLLARADKDGDKALSVEELRRMRAGVMQRPPGRPFPPVRPGGTQARKPQPHQLKKSEAKKPEAKKPEAKKPEAKKPEAKKPEAKK